MQSAERDGLEHFAWISLVQEVAERDGIAVNTHRIKRDGLHDRVVHDQEMSVELMSSAAAIFGRAGASS
jgi:hypothetical protein